MNLFYSVNISQKNNEITIEDQENIHLTKVLRRNVGENIYVTDGKSNLYYCEIIKSSKSSTILKIINQEKKEFDKPILKIGISLTKKQDRFEWFLEKSTEIGVSEITPIISRYSERNKLSLERSNKLLISAMKQSMRYHLPKLNNPVYFDDYLKQDNNNYNSFICTCIESNIPLLKDNMVHGENSNILIGPEGGFSKFEIDKAKNASFAPVSLGENRFRTETAGIIVCSIFSLNN